MNYRYNQQELPAAQQVFEPMKQGPLIEKHDTLPPQKGWLIKRATIVGISKGIAYIVLIYCFIASAVMVPDFMTNVSMSSKFWPAKPSPDPSSIPSLPR